MSDTWKPIEGETPVDPSGLKDRSVYTRDDLHRAEAENIRKAHLKYLASRPSFKRIRFDLTWMCKVHREMFGDVWLWAGELRTKELNMGLPASQVPAQLHDLAGTLAFWRQNPSLSLAEQTARLHHRAVWIHPFYNGNGRWARFLANVWQCAHAGLICTWPEDKVGLGVVSPIRSRYLAALRDADRGDFAPLILLQEEFTE